MPYIDPSLADLVLYLYPTRAAAQAGEHAGGTGFLFLTLDNSPAGKYETWTPVFAVSNEHVIRPPHGPTNPVIRLNTHEGGTEIVEIALDDWISHPDGDDLAIAPIPLDRIARSPATFVSRDELLTREDIERHGLGPGDDCFMLGRLIYHDGHQTNSPVVRFGNIAALPSPIHQPQRAADQESFIVEMRSLSGFSGAPVFVYFTTVGSRPQRIDPGAVALSSLVVNRHWLLGVEWGHLPAIPNLLGDSDDRQQLNSGMSAVVPAWKLSELVDHVLETNPWGLR